MKKRCIVLLSGGMDSATVLMLAAGEGWEVHALTFDYGQKNRAEIECAGRLASFAGAAGHEVFRVDPGLFGNSPLLGGRGEGKPPRGLANRPGTYVPGRNTVFLSCALCRAEVLGAEAIFYGANTVDFEGYPDCTARYIGAFNRLAAAGFPGVPVRIEAPFLRWTKARIIKKGIELGLDYSMTNSCYAPGASGSHCGECLSCRLRAKGLEEAKEGGKRHGKGR